VVDAHGALLIFLPVIVRTKHLHLLLAPVTIFLSREDSRGSRRWWRG